MQHVLVAKKEGVSLESYALHPTFTIVGRNSTLSHYAFEHPSLSRQHAALVYGLDGILYIVDLGSSHGTFVNGSKLPPRVRHPFRAGDFLTLGGSSREYTIEEAASAQQPPTTAAPAPVTAKPETREDREAAIRAAIASLPTSLPLAPPPQSEEFKDDAGEEEEQEKEEEEDDEDEYGIVEYGTSAIGAAPVGGADGRTATSRNDSQHNGQRHEESLKPDEEEEDEGIEGSEEPTLLPPTSHSFPLKSHRRTVTGVGVDPGGGRLASCSMDTTLRLFDFGGMDARGECFYEGTPFGDKPVSGLAWSSSLASPLIALCSGGGSKVSVVDREGGKVVTTVAGDAYLADMGNTKGHTTGVTGVGWVEEGGGRLLSCSRDGTVRVWDCVGGRRSVFKELECESVVKFKGAGGGGSGGGGITAFALANDVVVAGLEDGSLGVVGMRGAGVRYTGRLDGVGRGGHTGGGCISSLSWCPGGTGHRLASRGSDGRVVLWDARAWSSTKYLFGGSGGGGGGGGGSPLGIIHECHTMSAFNTLAWSPCGGYLLVGGESDRSGGGSGSGSGSGSSSSTASGILWGWNVAELESGLSRGSSSSSSSGASTPSTTGALLTPQASPVSTLSWCSKLNQVAVGYTGGGLSMLYRPGHSTKGALVSLARGITGKSKSGAVEAEQQTLVREGTIYAPNALPQYRDTAAWGGGVGGGGGGGKRGGRGGGAPPPSTTAPPLAPPSQPGREHPVWSKQSFTDHYLMAHPEVLSANLRAQDPQQVLQGYAGKSGGFTSVYSGTQPKAILAEKTFEEELDETRAKKRAKPSGQ